MVNKSVLANSFQYDTFLESRWKSGVCKNDSFAAWTLLCGESNNNNIYHLCTAFEFLQDNTDRVGPTYDD